MPEAPRADDPHRKSPRREASPRADAGDAEDLFSEANLTKVIKDYMPLVRHAVNRGKHVLARQILRHRGLKGWGTSVMAPLHLIARSVSNCKVNSRGRS